MRERGMHGAVVESAISSEGRGFVDNYTKYQQYQDGVATLL